MNPDQLRQVTKILEPFLKGANAQAALVCEANGLIVAGSGTYSKDDRELVLGLAPGLFPGTRRMAEKLNVNEAQMISIDNLHILIFWVAAQYFFLVFCRVPINPHTPPQSAVAACEAIRAILQPVPKKGWKFW
jgi:predicted regulator of Ras-like GTPase activity (Roadblock/LC7/MglB family)